MQSAPVYLWINSLSQNIISCLFFSSFRFLIILYFYIYIYFINKMYWIKLPKPNKHFCNILRRYFCYVFCSSNSYCFGGLFLGTLRPSYFRRSFISIHVLYMCGHTYIHAVLTSAFYWTTVFYWLPPSRYTR